MNKKVRAGGRGGEKKNNSYTIYDIPQMMIAIIIY